MLTFGVAAVAMSFMGCGSSFKGACNKAKECCSQVSICEEINKQGKGWEDRCGIGGDAYIDELHTYGKSECDKIANAQEDYASCLSGISCTDINSSDADKGHVSKCDDKAKAVCDAQKASADACGGNYGEQTCDNVKANIANIF
jgi:hypothetical protein